MKSGSLIARTGSGMNRLPCHERINVFYGVTRENGRVDLSRPSILCQPHSSRKFFVTSFKYSYLGVKHSNDNGLSNTRIAAETVAATLAVRRSNSLSQSVYIGLPSTAVPRWSGIR